MSDWESVTDVTCTCGFVYLSSQDYCPDCGYPTDVNQFDMVKSPKTRGLATAFEDITDMANKASQQFKKKSSQRANKHEQDGYVFDSTPELKRYIYLRKLELANIISKLTPHPQYELKPQLKVPANKIHPAFTQAREVYTPDFRYFWQGYLIIEDVKGAKKASNGKLKPYIKTPARNKHKAFMHKIYENRNEYSVCVFLLTVWHKKEWHYFNANQTEISFSLE